MFKKIILILLASNFTNYQTQATANLAALKRVQTHATSLAAYSTSSELANKSLLDDFFINHARTCRNFRDNKLKTRFDHHPLRKCFQDKQVASYIRTGPTYSSDWGIIVGQPDLYNQDCIDRGSPADQASFWAFDEILHGNIIEKEENRLLYYYLTYRVNIFKTFDKLDHKQALKIIGKIKKMATRLQAMGQEAFVQQDLALIRAVEPILKQKKDQTCAADITNSIQISGYQSQDQIWPHGPFDQALYEMVAKI